MSNLTNDNINLAAAAASPYRPPSSDPRPSFMSFQTPTPPDMSPQDAMAAAIAAAQSSAVAVSVPSSTEFSRTPVAHMDPSADGLSMRLPNMDLAGQRHHRPMMPTYPMNTSLPIPSSLPPVHANPAANVAVSAPLNSYSHAMPMSQFGSDQMPYSSRSSAMPAHGIYSAAQPVHAMHKPDQGIIPAAAQLIDTTASRGKGRAMNGAVRKKATTTRRKKSRTGPANYVCALVGCGKAFRMHGDLQTHMRKHTGDEPFACSFPDCGMRYKWRSSLSHHEGLHRKAKDFRLKPRRRRRSTATMLTMPTEQLLQNQGAQFAENVQPAVVGGPVQAHLVSPAAPQGTMVNTNGQGRLVGTAPLGRMS